MIRLTESGQREVQQMANPTDPEMSMQDVHELFFQQTKALKSACREIIRQDWCLDRVFSDLQIDRV
jgi:hypothetical protein